MTVTSHVQFTEVDLESCLSQVFGVHKLEGRGNLTLNVEGSGPSVLAVTNTLAGTASVTAHDGALAGINVEQLLRRLERRPLSGGGNFRNGSTPYDNLTIAVKFSDGVATAEDAGYFKLVFDQDTQRLIGAQMVSPAAAELIQLCALAIRSRVPASVVATQLAAHPSHGERLLKTFGPDPRAVSRTAESAGVVESRP